MDEQTIAACAPAEMSGNVSRETFTEAGARPDVISHPSVGAPAAAPTPPTPPTPQASGIVSAHTLAAPMSPDEELAAVHDADNPAARRAVLAPANPVPAKQPSVALPRPSHPRVFVVANQKGGVGKTTTAVNLAVALAQGNLKVLVIDLDPQGNASTALGVDHRMGARGSYEVLLQSDRIADDVVVSGENERVLVLPATLDLAGAEIELVAQVAREKRLHKALNAYLKTHEIDYVLIDCPPALGLLTINAFVAANEILLPIQCEYYALEGVTQLVRTIDLVKADLNENLVLSTVLLTMFDSRTRLSSQVADEVRAHFVAQTLNTVIPRSVRISEAPSYGQTVLTYDPSSVGSRMYQAAASEIAWRGTEPAKASAANVTLAAPQASEIRHD